MLRGIQLAEATQQIKLLQKSNAELEQVLTQSKQREADLSAQKATLEQTVAEIRPLQTVNLEVCVLVSHGLTMAQLQGKVARIETKNQQLKAKIYDAHQKEQELLAQIKRGGGTVVAAGTEELLAARQQVAQLERSLKEKEQQNQELAEIANSLLAKLDGGH